MKRALLIEDDDLYRQATRSILEDAGYRVVEAANGTAGLIVAKARPFDVILCDQRMGGLSGDAVLSALKRNPATATIPFIMITGNVQAAKEAGSLEADYYLAKPFTIAALRELLDAL